MVNRVTDVTFRPQSKAVEGRMSLTAQFIQGIDICESAIAEGLYSQAGALLKQEMETIEAINEYETGARRDGKTPRLNLLNEFGHTYGDFNNFSHVSVEDIHKGIVNYEAGGISGPSVIPQYQQDTAERFYGFQIFFIFLCARQMIKILRDVYELNAEKEELLLLLSAIKIIEDRGIIAPRKEPGCGTADCAVRL